MLTVSNYHYIRENFNAAYPSIFGITPSQFQKQLLLFKNEGDILDVREITGNIEEILSSRKNYFLITFDDGLKEQVDYALPILDELNVSALFFPNSLNFQERKISSVHKIHLLRSIIEPWNFLEIILKDEAALTKDEKIMASTHYRYDDENSAEIKFFLNFKMSIEKKEFMIESLFANHFMEEIEVEKLYMNQQDLINLAGRGWLGSHTHSHFPLGQLEKKEIEFELMNSKQYFEGITNSDIEIVSYPYGNKKACTIEVAAIAEAVGYKIGFTTTRGINTLENERLLLNRFNCNDLPGGKNYKFEI